MGFNIGTPPNFSAIRFRPDESGKYSQENLKSFVNVYGTGLRKPIHPRQPTGALPAGIAA
jgi:hypothetical protein